MPTGLTLFGMFILRIISWTSHSTESRDWRSTESDSFHQDIVKLGCFFKVYCTKAELFTLLSKEVECMVVPAGKIVVTTNGSSAVYGPTQIWITTRRTSAHDHEETDTRMLLYVYNAALYQIVCFYHILNHLSQFRALDNNLSQKRVWPPPPPPTHYVLIK